MGKSPRVSVIVATYNWSSVLRYAIESVLWQSFTDFELLVIGDGCTDDSAEVVASFRDPRIFWHNLPENSGHQSAPNNAALARARGEFVAYLGHDDLWHPSHLAGMVNALDESGAGLAYSWLEIIFPPAAAVRQITGISPTGEADPRIVLPPSSVMHRRELVEEIGVWKDYRSIAAAPDTEFFHRIHESGKRFVQVKQLTVFKFNAAARPDCYQQKPSHEQAEYMARMKREPDFLVRELSNYIELNQRRHPEDISWANPSPTLAPGAHVRESRFVRGLEEREIPPPRFPPLPLQRVSFASELADPFLWHGWSHRESAFRWTDGEKAAITFSAPAGVSLTLQMSLAPFLAPGTVDEQPVDVLLNGRTIAQLRLVDLELATHLFELPKAWLQQENVIALALRNATAPVTARISNDVRKLSLRVAWMEFSSVPGGVGTAASTETVDAAPESRVT